MKSFAELAAVYQADLRYRDHVTYQPGDIVTDPRTGKYWIAQNEVVDIAPGPFRTHWWIEYNTAPAKRRRRR